MTKLYSKLETIVQVNKNNLKKITWISFSLQCKPTHIHAFMIMRWWFKTLNYLTNCKGFINKTDKRYTSWWDTKSDNCSLKQENKQNDKERKCEDLENGGWRSDVRERGLDATGGISGESRLDKFPLQLEGGGSGGLNIAFGDLLGTPLVTGAPANEGENSHFDFELILLKPWICYESNRVKERRLASASSVVFIWWKPRVCFFS